MKTYKADLPEITIKYKSGDLKKCKICSSADSYNMLKRMFDSDTLEYSESSIVIYLNRANNSIGWQRVSQGGLTSTVIDVRIILSTALKCGATSIILSHNHPSGNLKPSQADIILTKKIKQGAELLEIQLLDHLILSAESYFSFADDGLL